jgi:apolipoprotein N-acyltransferase
MAAELTGEWWRDRPMARRLLLIGFGVLLSLAYPRPEWPWLAWISLVPLFFFSMGVRPKQAFLDGFLFGFAFFTLLLRWLDYTFQTYSAIPWPLTFVVVLLLSAYLACFIGGVAWAGSRLYRSFGSGLALVMLPFLWVTAELGRTYLLSGFPWGLLGYSQYRQLAIIQIAAWTGVYGLSWLCALVNAAITALLRHGIRGFLLGGLPASLIVLAVIILGARQLNEPPARALTVALVQASIDQATKWEPSVQSRTLALYAGLTQDAVKQKPAIVIWPETALPLVLRREPEVVDLLRSLSRENGAPLVVGSIDAVGKDRSVRLYNSTFIVTQQGIVDKYDKIHLVPFGEYVPLKWALGFVTRWAAFISELDSGTRPVVFQFADAPFGTVICYEGIFPGLFRQFVANGATWMVNVTNDAWFGSTNGPLQHLAMLPFRAVENRVGIARSANTGISTLIEPNGRIGPSLALFERGVLLGRVSLRGETTWYTRFGDLFAYGSAGLSLIVGVFSLRRRHSSR